MKRTAIGISTLLGLALLAGCYPEQPEYIDEYDLVFTDYSPTFDFQSKGTYAMPDSVVKITGNLEQGQAPVMVNPTYGNQILADIRSNMHAYGWTEVAVGENPDVIILPSVITTTTVSVWYPYWGWYYPWYGGWYYPGYYPPSVSSYSSGSLFIQMTDPHDITGTDDLPVVWLGVFNGLMEGSTSGLLTRIDNSVDQAFEQSKYLKQ